MAPGSPEAIGEVLTFLRRNLFRAFVQAMRPDYLMGWAHEEICDALDLFLADVVNGLSPRLMITMPPRHGKLLADSTPVLTTEGWSTHGELKPGVKVFGLNGQPTEVIAVGPPDMATHEVVFTNGQRIKVHLDHEWTVYDRPRRKWRTVETRWFIGDTRFGRPRSLWTGPKGRRGGRAMYQLPTPGPALGGDKELPIHPYVLGVWLGDGTSTKPCINQSREDTEVTTAAFGELGYKKTHEYVHKDTGVVSSVYGGLDLDTEASWHRPSRFMKLIRTLGLYDNKHIPDAYLAASLGQREALLAGLIDSDGYANPETGRIVISTAHERLAEGVKRLVASLGWRCGDSVNEPRLANSGIMGRKEVHQLCFNPDREVPVRLVRKRVMRLAMRRAIGVKEVVESAKPEPGRCVQVAAPDGLYLVGESCVPTHNSELVSRCFPAYILGKHPDMSIIAAAYAADLASQNNRDVQRIIGSEPYQALFPDTRLWGSNVRTVADGSYLRNSTIFEIVGHAGFYRSAGVGGGITGMGARVILVDDPIKNREDADSPTIREKLWDWYTSTLYTRQAPGAGIILIQTRWHMDDLAGRLLERSARGEGDAWRLMNYPALAEADEPRRKAGEPLHPERWSLAEMERVKLALGTRDWTSMYQQRPVPDEGAVFLKEWFKHWTRATLPAQFDRVIMSWDMSFKAGSDNDYTVGQVWGQKGADAYLLDQARFRQDFVPALGHFARLAEKWPQATEKLIEEAANGPAVIDMLKQATPGVVPVRSQDSKVGRARAVSAVLESGNVWFPPRGEFPWVDELTSELANFPAAAHDDQVDAMTQALHRLFRHRPMSIADGVIESLRARAGLNFGAFQQRAGAR